MAICSHARCRCRRHRRKIASAVLPFPSLPSSGNTIICQAFGRNARRRRPRPGELKNEVVDLGRPAGRGGRAGVLMQKSPYPTETVLSIKKQTPEEVSCPLPSFQNSARGVVRSARGSECIRLTQVPHHVADKISETSFLNSYFM